MAVLPVSHPYQSQRGLLPSVALLGSVHFIFTQLSRVCPQELAPHTGAIHSHLLAVRSLGGQRGSARSSLSVSKPHYPSVLGTPGPCRQCQHKLTPGHQRHPGCQHPVSQSLWLPRVSEKGLSSNNVLYRHTLHLWGRREVGVSPAPHHCTNFDRFPH